MPISDGEGKQRQNRVFNGDQREKSHKRETKDTGVAQTDGREKMRGIRDASQHLREGLRWRRSTKCNLREE